MSRFFYGLYTLLQTFKITEMENELNYISDKIEEVEHSIHLVEFGMPIGVHSKGDLLKLQNEKEMLENILAKLTEVELQQ
jgi:hypothetical protein